MKAVLVAVVCVVLLCGGLASASSNGKDRTLWAVESTDGAGYYHLRGLYCRKGQAEQWIGGRKYESGESWDTHGWLRLRPVTEADVVDAGIYGVRLKGIPSAVGWVICDRP